MIAMATALALVASACGGSAEDDFRSEMVDSGLMTDENVDCVLAAFAEAGIGVDSLSDGVLGDAEIPADAQDAVFECLAGGLDLGDFDFDSDSDADVIGSVDPDVDTRGDDAALDALWDSCAAGSGQACDDLFFQAPLGSEYERFGTTCGDRFTVVGQFCASELDSADPGVDTRGDDAALDALWDSCAAGDGQACDDLYFESPLGSDYERFGDTCGDRFTDASVLCANELD